ncbi:MAG: S-adenosylmethionine hydrolase [Glaciecola sp.]|jgi:S-adenosylmethionine hydrolase
MQFEYICAYMAIVTLTTDLGTKDFYAASIKGRIYTLCPNVSIVDITHEVPPFDVEIAAFSLKNTYKDFPKGSIHIIGVDPVEKENQKHVIVFHDDHYFVSADNGLFSFLFDIIPDQVLLIDIASHSTTTTFPAKDIFATVAAHLASGKSLDEVTSGQHVLVNRSSIGPTFESNTISGHAIYVDSMGNITTDITKEAFKKIGLGRNFEVGFRRPGNSIQKISRYYNQVPAGEKIALFNNFNSLEIAINQGNASKLFGMKRGDVIRVNFVD